MKYIDFQCLDNVYKYSCYRKGSLSLNQHDGQDLSLKGMEGMDESYLTWPGLTPEAALRLELDIELEEKEELTIITMLACGLKYIWEARLEKKTVYLFKMRAEVEARVSVLRC